MPAALLGGSRSVLILYGSETGNAQDIAEELGRLCQRLHFKSHVDPLDAADLNSLLQYQLVVFVISTTGQGDMPHNSLLFWKKLLRKRLPAGCLSQLNYTCFGLGDSTYIKFNWAARKLIRRLDQLGANTFLDCFEADERFNDGTEGAFTAWADRLYKHLLEQYPSPNGLEPIPDDIILPPRWTLSPALDKIRNQKPPSVGQSRTTPSHSDLPPSRLLPVPEGLDAKLVEMKRMTPKSHWQDVRLVGFDIPSPSATEKLQCNPGDCLTIYPKNFPDDVQKLITLMDWGSIADEALDLAVCGPLPRGLYTPEPCTIRNLLLENIDISSIPRRSFLRSMSYFATNQDQKERLIEFTSSEFLDEYFDYATRSRRTIIEVLDEFTSVKIPADRLLDVFPLIHGRDFSIATGGNMQFEKAEGEEPVANSTTCNPTTRVELLIALVRYRTILRKPREGLCSRYVDSLPLNSVIRVSYKRVLTPIHGPDNVQRPLVAIATGTGIAPIRSLIYERLTHPNPAPMLLFFGNRNRKADYFFEDEWNRLASTGALRVMTAFSRDQEGKVYVQHVLGNQASQLGDLIMKNAVFAVCGGSSKMADACKEAVFEPFKEGGDKDVRQKLLDSLTWWQEIW